MLKKELIGLWMIFLVISLSFSVAAESRSYDLTYDKNGNLQQSFDQYLEYNELNQLVRVREINSSGQILEEYFYDDQGVRLTKFDHLLNETTFYINENFVQVINETGTYTTVYYHDGNTLIAREDPDGSKFYYHPDHLGSTDTVTNDSRDVVELTTYKPYGQVIDGGDDRFLYAGKERDKNTGLDYLGARYYNSFPGLFTQPDVNIPDMYNPQDLNRYSYVRNNPYKYVDPSGEFAETFFDVVFIGYGIYNLAKNPSWKNAGALGIDIGFAAVPILPNLKRIGEAAKLAETGLDAARAGENAGDVASGVDRAGDLGKTTDSKNLPDFYSTSDKQIVPSHTPEGREISVHAASRMANPPPGRIQMTPSEIDSFMREVTLSRIDPLRQTTMHFAPDVYGKSKSVVTSNTNKGRVVTVIKKPIKGGGRR